jgi:hypothetical protein
VERHALYPALEGDYQAIGIALDVQAVAAPFRLGGLGLHAIAKINGGALAATLMLTLQLGVVR